MAEKKVHHLTAKNMVVELYPRMKIESNKETQTQTLKYELAYRARDENEDDLKPKEKVRDDEIVFETKD